MENFLPAKKKELVQKILKKSMGILWNNASSVSMLLPFPWKTFSSFLNEWEVHGMIGLFFLFVWYRLFLYWKAFEHTTHQETLHLKNPPTLSVEDDDFLKKWEWMLRNIFALPEYLTVEECLLTPIPNEAKRLLLLFRKLRYSNVSTSLEERQKILHALLKIQNH